MSNEQLMQQAADIEQGAAFAEYRQRAGASPRGYALVDYEEIKRKYQGCAQPLFEPFTRMPDPASYDGAIESLHAAMEELSQGAHLVDPINGEAIGGNRDLTAIVDAADELGDWTGMAASNFKTNFLTPFPVVASNQFLILGIMKGAVEADKAVWESAREDIDKIARATLDALENLGGCGKNGFEFALAVATAVASVAGIPFTGGASAVVAGVGAAANVAGAAAKGAEVLAKGGGGSAEQIVGSMKTAIEKLTGQIRDKQGQIAKTLTGYAGEVEQHKLTKPSPFFSPRPQLADMRGSELTGDKGVGEPE
ncbi:hypothetical protein [Amycolatopsis cihanbeyliensis]|uniref:Type VII secretion system (Wss) protein ESAT-6 n=1 Tax=Amycolatopsis cihanbeyliensis TaxID=1128664 RepID=A0A542DNT4_AMYCI|nr:hypothetical protein [Amycolatopsis cihanbeyliensis]TQJ04762.1 hypothetical protein FB471_4571 [Amycolatopsis cihanbeyliensis]